ncbi:MAG: TonB-dependent receptor [bacterium]|nr:TonB-dependent receptor [bacterium]
MANQRLTWVLLSGLFLLSSLSVSGQTTGDLRGKIADAGGQALPGVTVVLSGDAVAGAGRTDVTGPTGGFQFPGLPVGLYTVTATLDGYQKQAVENVKVSLGAVATVNFNLPEEFSDEVTVIAEAPIVDLASPNFSTRFEADQIEDLPTRGHFFDTLAVSPGVVQITEGSNMISAFGADVQSNQWNIDGLDRTAPEGGYLWWSLNDEMIAEVQVLGTGAGAEYGGMLGTAFNVVTKSGTNVFHGSASLDYWNPDWVDTNARREDAPAGTQTYQLDHHNNLAMTLGGPIKQDKVWFFAGVEFGRFQAFWPFQDPNLEMQKASWWDNYDLKLSTQPAGNHNLALMANDHEYLGPDAGDVFNEPTSWSEMWQHDKMVSLDYSWIVGTNTFIEARGGIWRGDNAYRPQYPSDEPSFVDMTVEPWRYYGTLYWSWDWEQHTDDAEIIITNYAEEFIKGDHEFRFGVQYTKGGGTTKTFNPDYYYQQEYEYYPGYPYVYQYLYTGLPYYYGGDAESVGVFVSDSWTVSDRLTLNLGVRYDRHQGWIPAFNRIDMDSNPTGEVIPGRDMIDWDSIDPRFGFSWQPTTSGKTVVRGSIGLFHGGAVSGQWYSPPPEAPTWSTYWLNGDEWELLWEWPPFPDTFLVEGTENASTWEFTLGMEHQLWANSAIGVQLVYKETKDLIGWHILDNGEYDTFIFTDPVTGEQFELRDYYVEPSRLKGNSTGPGSLGGDRPYQQNYEALFLTYKKRLSDDWDLTASYSYSKAWGLNPRFFGNGWDGQGGAFFASREEADPNSFLNADKLLAGDRRHVLRVVANYMLPWKLKLSTVVNIQSGRTYDRQQWVRLPNRGWTGIISEPASNDLRMPTQYLWDISLGKHFRVGDKMNLSLDLQVLNVLNDDAPEYWRTRDFRGDEEPIPREWVLPRRTALRLRLEF